METAPVPPPRTFDPTETLSYLRAICSARETIARTERICGDTILTAAQRDELPRLRAHIEMQEAA